MVTLSTPSDQGWDVPQNSFLSILSFAHTLQTPNGWTGNTFEVSRVFVPNETDPLRGEFHTSSTFVHFLPKPYSRLVTSPHHLIIIMIIIIMSIIIIIIIIITILIP
jgi:hypothetical protein